MESKSGPLRKSRVQSFLLFRTECPSNREKVSMNRGERIEIISFERKINFRENKNLKN